MISLYGNTNVNDNGRPYLKSDKSVSSPAYDGRYFVLKPAGNKNMFPDFKIFKGIANEVPSIRYSTSWSEGPTMKLAEKAKTFLEHELIKTFAAANDNYKPVIATDSWTQQYPKDGTYIEIPLNFRAYPVDQFNTLNYFSTIYQLIMYTTPEKYNFTDSLKQVELGMQTAASKGMDIGEAINQFTKLLSGQSGSTDIQWADLAKNLANHTNGKISTEGLNDKTIELAQSLESILETLNSLTANYECGCQQFSLSFGGTNGSVIRPTFKGWLITSWSFKPAVQTTQVINNKKNIICPIYVDIKINVKSAVKISTEEFAQIFNLK